MLRVDKFRLTEPALITPDLLDRFQNYYGVDLAACNDTERQVLIEYVNYGAAAAIMALIDRIQQSQLNSNSVKNYGENTEA